MGAGHHNKQQKELPAVILDDLYHEDCFDFYLTNLSKHGNAFPQLLLYSAMIMACSLFESSMRLVFESMNHFRRTSLHWEKISGTAINKTAKLLKEIDLRLKDEKNYISKFSDFFMVRNCIVHNNGSIDEFRRGAKLLEYAKNEGLVLNDDSEHILELNRSYCEAVCETFERFFSIYLLIIKARRNKS